jgi:hypothetical protein
MRAAVLFTVLALLASFASATYIVSRDTKNVVLKAGTLKGKVYGLVSYKDSKGPWNVLFNNAKNAIPWSSSKKQTEFKLDRKGGWGFFKDAKAYKQLKNQCKPNASLKKRLPDVVAACTMPDKTHWVLQKWQRLHKNMGVKLKKRVPVELHLSHFDDAHIPKLWMKWSWSKTQGYFDHLYGAFSCNGWPVIVDEANSQGNPQDGWGRNIYVDIINPVWTKAGAYTKKGGWITWNSFLAHKPNGFFCATIWKELFKVTYPGPDKSTRFRAQVQGPGVTPIVRWEGPPPGNYVAGNLINGNYLLGPSSTPNPALKRQPYSDENAIPLNAEQRAIAGPKDSCYKIWGKY